MTLGDFVERFGRTLFEAPFGGGSPRRAGSAELAEIRHAILEEIEGRTQRTGGRNLFPYNRVTVLIRGADDQQASALSGSFLREYFHQEIVRALEKADAEHPDRLQVNVEVSSEPPGKREAWLLVLTRFDAPEEQPVSAEAPVRVETLRKAVPRLVVVMGSALPGELTLDQWQTNLGRSVDVYRTQGLSRRNHVAFGEEDEISLTVSREHAHILRDRDTGEYRLFNDRFYLREKGETCNLWIVRGGATQEVHRNTRGVRLEDGDEIHLGRAVLRFGYQV
jgi:hypothetical protein